MQCQDNIKGLSFAVIANIAFVINSGLMHQAIENGVSFSGLLLIGSFVKWIISHAMLKYNKLQYELQWNQQTKLVILCQSLNTPSFLLFAIALQYITVRFAMIIENIGPFIVAIVSYIFIKEKTSITELLNMFICLAVIVAIVISPSRDTDTHNQIHSIYYQFIGILLTIVSLILFSGTYVINRFLKQSNYIILNAQNTLFSLVFSFIIFIVQGQYTLSFNTIGFGICNGLLAFICSLLFIKAGQLQPASRIASLDFSQVPLGFIMDYFVFNCKIGLIEFIGCVLICISGLFIFRIAFKEQYLSDISTRDDLETPLISQSFDIDKLDQYFQISIPRLKRYSTITDYQYTRLL